MYVLAKYTLFEWIKGKIFVFFKIIHGVLHIYERRINSSTISISFQKRKQNSLFKNTGKKRGEFGLSKAVGSKKIIIEIFNFLERFSHHSTQKVSLMKLAKSRFHRFFCFDYHS